MIALHSLLMGPCRKDSQCYKQTDRNHREVNDTDTSTMLIRTTGLPLFTLIVHTLNEYIKRWFCISPMIITLFLDPEPKLLLVSCYHGNLPQCVWLLFVSLMCNLRVFLHDLNIFHSCRCYKKNCWKVSSAVPWVTCFLLGAF